MKEWFILVKQREEGPYSINQLRHNPSLTPETYARKIGWTAWKMVKEIPELKDIFEYVDEEDEESQNAFKKNKGYGQGELILNRSMEPNRFLFWLTIIILIIIAIYLYSFLQR